MAVIDQVFFLVLNLLDAGFGLILPVALSIMATVLGWALTRLCFQWFAGADNVMSDIIGLIVVTFLFLCIALSAKSIVDAAGNFAVSVGVQISGADIDPVRLVTPSGQWSIGADEAAKILKTKKALCTSTWECIKTFPDQLLLEIAALFIYMAFAFIIFEMASTAIGYKVSGLFALLFSGFAVAPFTKNLSEGAIQGWQTHLVKLAIIAIVAGIGSRAFELMDLPDVPVMDDIIPAVLLSVFIAWLAWQSRALAAGIISAVPQLSGSSIVQGAGNMVRAAAGGISTVDRARAYAQREASHIGGNAMAVRSAASNLLSGNRGQNTTQPPSTTPNSSTPSGATAGSGQPPQSGGPGAGGVGGAWNQPPTPRQQQAAGHLGVNLAGLNRGQASAALQQAGAGRSWWQGAQNWNGGP